MLQCYVLTCGRSVTVFWAAPRSQRLRQGPRSPTQRPALVSRLNNIMAENKSVYEAVTSFLDAALSRNMENK
jgi:hypothetical protein